MADELKPFSTLSPEQRALFNLRLRRRGSSSRAPREPAIVRGGERAEYPPSFEQEQLWFLHQLNSQSTLHHLNRTSVLQGPLDVPALARSVDEIVRRHEILRTRFVTRDGQPVQVVAPAQAGALALIDLRDVPEVEREAEVMRLATEQARRPFDLAEGPLMRTTLLRSGTERHVFLLTIHHIITDWWSFKVVYRELSVLYNAFSSGMPSPLADLPIQFGDYALWQHRHLQGDTLETLLKYWKRQLAGAPTLLELPTDRPRPSIQTFRGVRLPFVLPMKLYEPLKELSRRENVTSYTTLLAVFQTLLHRYTNQEDILVGTPSANRSRGETEGLIGFLLNNLILRADFSNQPSFREVLRRLRKVVLGANAHQELPFRKVVAELRPERSLSSTPLIQVNFIFLTSHAPTFESLNSAPGAGLGLEGLSVSGINIQNVTSEFDLSLVLEEIPDGLDCFIEYSTDLFDDETIKLMVEHLGNLMEAVARDPDARVSRLNYLTREELTRLTARRGEPVVNAGGDFRSVRRMFEEQAGRTPDAVALTFGEERLSYRDLNRRANQLARHLRALGVGAGTLVGIFVERSAEMLVGLLGVLKAGAAYVPLDPEYPRARLDFMREDARVEVLLTQKRLAGRVPASASKVVYLDANREIIAREEAENLPGDVTPDELAYVIYTSGSTGRPKGVQVTHRAVANLLASVRRRPGLDAQDVLVSVTSLSFDIAALELFLPLIVGARLVLVSRETAMDGARLSEELANSGATTMQATPATWLMLVEAGWPGGGGRFKALCGGEALPRELAAQLLERGISLWNMYGPTETTIWSTLRRVESADAPITIGHSIADTDLYVLDPNLQPVPTGVPGELYIGGAGLARGYLRRPGLTAEKFVPHPFAAEPGARLYRTGDRARQLSDGSIDFLGRLDHQVKLRGFRIELGEIESALRECTGRQEVVVSLREDVPGDKRLVAYVAGDPRAALDAELLRERLREKLPEYMLPSSFVRLERLPLTPNGKLDKGALPPPDGARPASTQSYVPPRNGVEGVIANIWRAVLGVDEVGAHDNFFDLGGHSLLLSQVHHKLFEAFGGEVQILELFQYPTVSALAEHLSRRHGAESALALSEQRGATRKKSSSRRRLRKGRLAAETQDPV